MIRSRLSLVGLLTLGLGPSCFSSQALANWSLNVGYHNPHGSQLGVNFLYWGKQWNFEAGLGWIEARVQETGSNSQDEESTVRTQLFGDLDLKYRFSSGSFAPYLQAGMGTGTGLELGEKSQAGLTLSSPFVGLGVMVGQKNFYACAAYDYFLETEAREVQAGLGFSL